MSKLTAAHIHAIETFDRFPLGSDEIETIDLDAGREVIAQGLVALQCAVIGHMWLKPTPAGCLALSSQDRA